jgi:hypothetical protein
MEAAELALAVAEDFFVRDDLWHLEAEAEAGRRPIAPALDGLAGRGAVKGAVYLDDRVARRIGGEVIGRGEVFGVEDARPFLVRPTTGADVEGWRPQPVQLHQRPAISAGNGPCSLWYWPTAPAIIRGAAANPLILGGVTREVHRRTRAAEGRDKGRTTHGGGHCPPGAPGSGTRSRCEARGGIPEGVVA